MNDFFLILLKTAVFIISYLAVSRAALKYFIKRNPSANILDIEIVVVSVILSVSITSIVKHIFKLFI